MSPPPVSIVTVAHDGYFFVRLLVERVRDTVRDRTYEIVVVDRGSRDGTREWLERQPDVRVVRRPSWWRRGHRHGDAAEAGVRAARHERIVLLDSDAHPVDPDWLVGSVDRLDDRHRLAGALFGGLHRGNPHGWYIHPHFMCFRKSDLGSLVVLRKVRGEDTDTGEEATIRVLAASREVIALPIGFSPEFAVGNSRVPTMAGGVFHAWYVTRLEKHEAEVARETGGEITRDNYLVPLTEKLRRHYGLAY